MDQSPFSDKKAPIPTGNMRSVSLCDFFCDQLNVYKPFFNMISKTYAYETVFTFNFYLHCISNKRHSAGLYHTVLNHTCDLP